MKTDLSKIVQRAPFTILIEPTEGCNLGCSFCGLRGIRERETKPWNFMTIETAEKISKEIARVGWNAKIVFAQHGEPTLNPNLLDIIRIFRKNLPKNIFHLYTNGYGFAHSDNIDKYTNDIFNAGINNINVDCYSYDGDWNFVQKLKDQSIVVLYEKGIPLYTNNMKPRILILPPIKDENKITRKLANHAGAAFPPNTTVSGRAGVSPFLMDRYL